MEAIDDTPGAGMEERHAEGTEGPTPATHERGPLWTPQPPRPERRTTRLQPLEVLGYDDLLERDEVDVSARRQFGIVKVTIHFEVTPTVSETTKRKREECCPATGTPSPPRRQAGR